MSTRATRRWWAGVLGASVVLAALLAARGPQLAVDSSGYLDHSPMRSAGYPLLLDVARLLAGAQGGLRLAVFLQSLGSFTAIALLIDRLRGWLGAGPLVQALAAVALMAGPVAFAGAIISESLAFTCFIAAAARALDAACDHQDSDGRHLVACAVFLAGATLARPQFLFAWPLLALGVLAHVVMHRAAPPSRRLRLPLALVVVVVGQWSIQHGYNQLRHGRLQGAGLTGLQVATVNLYLADGADVDAIAATLPPDDSRALQSAWRTLKEKRLLASTAPGGYTPAMYFHHVYNNVCWEAIAAAWGLAEDSPVPVERWDHLDAVTRSVAFALLARHPARYVRHVVAMMWWQYKFFLVLALGAGVLATASLLRSRGDGNAAARALLIAAALWFANLTLVCMVELPIARYCFYTDGLLVAVALPVLGRALAVPAGGATAPATSSGGA